MQYTICWHNDNFFVREIYLPLKFKTYNTKEAAGLGKSFIILGKIWTAVFYLELTGCVNG